MKSKFIPATQWVKDNEPDEGDDPNIIELADLHAKEMRALMQPGYGK